MAGPLQLFGDFGLAGGQDAAPNYLQDSQICINFYPEVDRQDAKEVVGLLGCPGLIQLVAAPGGGIAPVDGSQLFPEIFADSNVAEVGNAGALVSFASNGTLSWLLVSTGAAGSVLPNWYAPTTTAIGSTHWVRTTQLTGPWGSSINQIPGIANGAWTSLASTQLLDVESVAVAGTYSATMLVEIGLSSSGPAVTSATWTFNFTIAP